MNPGDPNVAELLKQLRDDTTSLVRGEVALAKTELTEKASTLSRNVALLIGGALLGYAALTPLLFGIGYLLRHLFVSWGWGEGGAIFAGLLVVALITGGIAAAIVFKALDALKKEKLAPRKTIESLKEGKEMIQNKLP